MAQFIENIWYGRYPLWWLLYPVEIFYRMVINLRRYGYQRNWLVSTHLPVPVIVVGNITVGGTGKTPLVLWITQFLIAHGWRPGIISRGYGGRVGGLPREIGPHDDPREVGDEPVLLARRTQVPLVVGKDRVRAGLWLLKHHSCDCLIADDGLQHYALVREIEIVITDRTRGFGNHRCLPAGPLRESTARLQQISLRVAHGPPESGEYMMTLIPDHARLVRDGVNARPLATFCATPVHAVAGIGYPERFFLMLRTAGLSVITHPFPDHHAFRPEEISFDDEFPVLMTEKDAVKCIEFAQARHWFIPVNAQLAPEFGADLLARLCK